MAQNGSQTATRPPSMRPTPHSAMVCTGTTRRDPSEPDARRTAQPRTRAECWAEFWTIIAREHADACLRETAARKA